MKKLSLAIALAIATLGTAQAQSTPAAPADKPLKFLIGGGVTFGGDKLVTGEYTNGTEYKLHAGGTLATNFGIDYQFSPQFSMQGTVGYHVDAAGARNGTVLFQRVPFEVLAYYNHGANWRFGGGARYVTNTRLSSDGAAYVGNYDFDNTVSLVLETEYRLNAHIGFKLRLVDEDFTQTGTSNRIKANHIGLMANYYF
jgi:hypothetical protein